MLKYSRQRNILILTHSVFHGFSNHFLVNFLVFVILTQNKVYMKMIKVKQCLKKAKLAIFSMK